MHPTSSSKNVTSQKCVPSFGPSFSFMPLILISRARSAVGASGLALRGLRRAAARPAATCSISLSHSLKLTPSIIVINVSYSNTQREINQDQPGLTAAKIILSRRRHSDGGTVSAATPVPRLSPAQRVPAWLVAAWAWVRAAFGDE